MHKLLRLNCRCFFIILLLLKLCPNHALSQSYIGFSVGINGGTFFDFDSKDYYTTKYPYRVGFSSFLSYDFKIDSSHYIRIAGGYDRLTTGFKIGYNLGHGAYYKNLAINADLLTVEGVLPVTMYEDNSNNISFLLGASLSCTLASRIVGSGWDTKYHAESDTSGDTYFTFYQDNWTLDDRGLSYISRINAGINIGAEYRLGLLERKLQRPLPSIRLSK